MCAPLLRSHATCVPERIDKHSHAEQRQRDGVVEEMLLAHPHQRPYDCVSKRGSLIKRAQSGAACGFTRSGLKAPEVAIDLTCVGRFDTA